MFKKIRAYFERKFANIVFWEIDFWTTFMEDNASEMKMTIEEDPMNTEKVGLTL